jgi:hypothetical protein
MSIEVHPISATIDSDLGSLADALSLVLVERDTAAPLSPIAQSWRALDQGDLIRVRLGLVDLGYDDYGIFRVDQCSIEVSESQVRQSIRARDKAALLIDEGRPSETTVFALGSYPDDDPEELTNPSARTLLKSLAERVGLGLVWDAMPESYYATDYRLKSFTISPEDSLSSQVGRILDPLRVSRRYYCDAWVDGENLVVRRRGNGASAGTLDCSKGIVTAIQRTRQAAVGLIEVKGDHYITPADLPLHETQVTETYGQAEGSVRFEVLLCRETADREYTLVRVKDRTLGRLLAWGPLQHEKITVEQDLNDPDRTTVRVQTAHYLYDWLYRTIERRERVEVYRDGEWVLESESLVRFAQVTPTDVQTTTFEWALTDDGQGGQDYRLKAGFPRRVTAPGTLQSGLQVPPQDEAQQYGATANGGGSLKRTYSNDQLQSDYICSLIADDLAAESGKWLYTVSLQWPRPFLYRKGQKVTLTQLPGGCPDLVDSVITRLHTSFDEEAASWVHEASFEAWRDE